MANGTVEVGNFDVMRLNLRKELSRLNKSLGSSMSGGLNLNMDVKGLKELTEVVISLAEFVASVDYKPTFNIPEWDYISRTLTDSDTETYVYKRGGSSGTTVATVIINYTDSTLETILDVTRT